MKQSVIDILIYLFEHYFDDEFELEMDRDRVKLELCDAGFERNTVTKAFEWLQGLTGGEVGTTPTIRETATSVRVYAYEEACKLDAECRGFIHFLECAGVLNPSQRELVIDRILALDIDDIDIAQLRWIVMMVLFNGPANDQAFVWMEDIVMDDNYGCVH